MKHSPITNRVLPMVRNLELKKGTPSVRNRRPRQTMPMPTFLKSSNISLAQALKNEGLLQFTCSQKKKVALFTLTAII